MYVCICNAVTEGDVNGCMADGCTTAKEVKAACGFKPGCGMCTKRIHTMVSEYRTASELADALTGGPATLTPVPEAPRAPRVPGPGVHVPGPAVPEQPFTEQAVPERPGPAPDVLAQTAAENTEGGAAPQTAA
ncbi:(2Fe-2S)-binding protein [Actinomadura sp. 7K507]|uniref:(2Fe-2S)-binding protein n=1 Tax=Actinomadura sp. 7K507 TaxID=2530365 RepID=UPI001A9DCCE0|nr:(2Fe-2S)-binding protein [Actinomadura sp. 7K507]